MAGSPPFRMLRAESGFQPTACSTTARVSAETCCPAHSARITSIASQIARAGPRTLDPLAFGEAFATLRKADVSPHTFLEVMSTLFGSPVYASYGRVIADEKFEPAGFALRLGLKDIRLVLQAAEDFAAPMPLEAPVTMAV